MNETPNDLFEAAVAAIAPLFRRGEFVVAAYSGGKDSTAVLICAVEALRRTIAQGLEPLPLVVGHNDTGIENPEVARHARDQLRDLEEYALDHGLPVVVKISGPTLADSFAVKTVGGLAMPVFANAASRRCSTDWKVRPGARMARRLIPDYAARCRETLRTGESGDAAYARQQLALVEKLEMPVTLIGTRLAESAGRAARMAERGEHAVEVAENRDDAGKLLSRTLSPIMHWAEEDVWELLATAGDRPDAAVPAWRADFDETVRLYRDSGGGECVIAQIGKEQPKSACGARHGCSLCLVAGQEDKSLKAMLANPAYAHLQGVMDLRTWLLETRYDWSLRTWIPRKVEDSAMTVQPAAYSAETCAFLLRALATLDLHEHARAQAYDAALRAGERPFDPGMPPGDFDEERAQVMRRRQFRFLDPETLVAIDFNWALYGLFREPFEAIRIALDVLEYGRTVAIPRPPKATPQPAPKARALPLPGYDDMPSTGVSLSEGTADAGPLFGEAIFAEEEIFSVDRARARPLIAAMADPDSEPAFLNANFQDPTSAVRFYLANRIVRPAKGRLGWIDQRMRQTQKLLALGIWKGMTPEAARARCAPDDRSEAA